MDKIIFQIYGYLNF